MNFEKPLTHLKEIRKKSELQFRKNNRHNSYNSKSDIQLLFSYSLVITLVQFIYAKINKSMLSLIDMLRDNKSY